MNLSRLEGFFWVAHAGGYSAAARAFPRPITQPAIHQQVRRLEEELEVELFEQITSRRVRLTPAGQELYDYCRPFFEGLADALHRVRAGGERRRIRIEAAGLVLRELIPPWVQRVRRARPDLDLELAELATPDLDRLRRGEVDLLIDHLPRIPSWLRSREVARAHPFVVLPRDHEAVTGIKRGEALDLTALRDTPFVSYAPDLPQHAQQLAAVREHVGAPSEVVAASSADLILAFVAAGVGYSVIPWLDRKGPRRKGVVTVAPPTPAAQPSMRFPIVAAWSERHPAAPTLAQLSTLLGGPDPSASF